MKYTPTLAADPAKAPVSGSPEEGRFFQAFFAFNQEIEEKGLTWAVSRFRMCPLQPRSAPWTGKRLPRMDRSRRRRNGSPGST